MAKSVDEILNEMESGFDPTLSTVREYFSRRVLIDSGGRARTPLIGEEAAALQTFLHFVVAESPTLVMAYSGTGKTVLIDAVLDLIPEGELFSIQQGSETSPWYNAAAINRARFVEFPELQKATQNIGIVEILKNWGEGKDAKREKTDIIKEKEGENPIDEQLLKWHPFISSAAIGNVAAKPVLDDDEFMRRVLEVRTDPSQEMTKRVVGYKMARWGKATDDAPLTPYEVSMLKGHISEILNKGPTKYVNPAYKLFEDVIPTALPVARSYVDNLIRLTNAVGRFYYKKRIILDENLYLTPQDLYEASRIYIKDFIEGCMKLPLLGREILNVFPSHKLAMAQSLTDDIPDNCKLTIQEVSDKLESIGVSLDVKSVNRILAHLCMNHFLIQDENDKRKRFHRSVHTADYDGRVDWKAIVKACADGAPNDEYRTRFCGSSIVLTDPITGEKVDILALPEEKVEQKKHVDVEKLVSGLKF